ncbi:TPA: DUF551 domain-containing protein [Escherichia coli]|uniref:DUF551 domain-containing protein n=1 Tax=Escherichia coli TaxID=562 RepID=UPI000B7DC9CC|nr:DUF551 domain-containing protein [Escherichia coli]EEZ9830328.1 DUF551 domain-containing protein [Escherichia coli O153]EFH3667529.1 DUF551 domain-containing protein [Escherichia coli]EFH3694695.1 DUF551 domain-containing protein [Escherichia coli]EFJ0294232.1 DUF551 domain-containing protein [Escherichia coli]EFN7328020.1 DUF551 domain-containing protein [Escherichia coli]
MTFTKEQLIEKLKHRISVASEFPESEKAQMDLDLARIALASLEAEPVAYIFKHPAGKLFWALTDESNKDQSDVIPVYAAPPVPVVPAALPENDDEDGHDIDYLEPSEVYSLGRTAGWNACRDAMLHGAEPVSQTYKLNELSGNSPVTPDSWISCSDRMPDKLIPVMVMYEDGEMWSAMWNGNRWDDGTEYPDPHSVTHWREMPAAPQQEVK